MGFDLDNYVGVHERIISFRAQYSEGRIQTTIIDHRYAGDGTFEGQPNDAYILMRAEIYGNLESDNPIAVGHAFEQRLDTKSYVNKTSYIENCECVPLGTEILTKDGFKFYYQLRSGDLVLTTNCETRVNEWQPLESLSVFPKKTVVRASTSRFRATFTPNHKWLYEKATGSASLVPFNEISTVGGRLVLVGEKYKPTERNAERRQGEMLGWLFTDGEITYTKNKMPSTAYVRQSKTVNFPTLVDLFGDQFNQTVHEKENWLTSREWIIKAETVREILGIWGIKSRSDLPKAVASMTIDECYGFYTASMSADGWGNGFAKSYCENIEAMQIAAARLGVKTGIVTVKKPSDKTTKDLFVLPIHSTDGAYISEMDVESLPPMDVWCPTVKNGTWFARQNGQVWLTGNTSAVGRALAMLGYGIKGGIASREEMEKVQRMEAAAAKREAVSAANTTLNQTRQAPPPAQTQALPPATAEPPADASFPTHSGTSAAASPATQPIAAPAARSTAGAPPKGIKPAVGAQKNAVINMCGKLAVNLENEISTVTGGRSTHPDDLSFDEAAKLMTKFRGMVG